MKRILFLIPLLASPLTAQWAVFDPTNFAVNTLIQSGQAANHLEILRQWAVQIETLNRQLRELEQQLAVARQVRDVMGNPTAAGGQVILRGLGANDLARTYGDTLAAVRRLTDATASLRRTAEGIYGGLDDRTSLGRSFTRSEPHYRRYAAVERQAENAERVVAQTSARSLSLQADLAQALVALRDASTQAEVDKLNITVAALNGQLAVLAAQRRDEADKLAAQQIQNDNQAAKERQDLLERQIAEERHTIAAVNTWQQSIRLTPTNYTQR
ncbi:MAG: hypothetical protein JNK23_04540 [Opitutaceae bacterium]|nr:hypothetical protein [Opitutaceae bacterium]